MNNEVFKRLKSFIELAFSGNIFLSDEKINDELDKFKLELGIKEEELSEILYSYFPNYFIRPNDE